MSERFISALMVVATIYGTLFYLDAKQHDLACLFAVLSAISFYVVHVCWTAPIFAEDMPAADLQQGID